MPDRDDYDPDALDEKEEDEEYNRESTKERIIALIDADQAMLSPLAADEDKTQSYLAWVLEVLEENMMHRIKSSPNDEIGIVFYSTKESSKSEDLRSFSHVYEYLPLGVPDADTVRKLRDFTDAAFQQQPGCDDVSTNPGRAAEDLKNGLWACWDLLTKGGSSSSQARVDKTLLIFTNNSNPLSDAGENAAHLREQLYSRARELGGLAVSMELVPLIQLQDADAFDFAPFWRQLLVECSSAARGLEDSLAEQGQEVASQMDEQVEGLGMKLRRIRGMMSRLNRKRPLASTTLALTPDLKIGVQLFSLIQIAKKPGYKYVTRDKADIIASSNALVSSDTGTILPAVSHKVFMPDKKLEDRFPKVMLSNQEEKQLKQLRPKGLNLLGFKPTSCLKDSHQLGPSRFVYPDERRLKGSTAAFAALHRACATSDPQMAVCSYISRTGGHPYLVALLPQRAEVYQDDSGNVEWMQGPGFHMVTLPYKDDIRAPEAEASFLKRLDGLPPRASSEQVAAAEALIGALSLDAGGEEPFSSTAIANPHLERHWQVLEDLAMGYEPRDMEQLEDDTRPATEDIDAHQTTIDAFKLAVWGSLEGPATQTKKTAGTKRKAEPEVEATVAEEYAKFDWKALAAQPDNKGLGKLTIKVLKVYLIMHGLAVSGNKPELVARIKDHIANQV